MASLHMRGSATLCATSHSKRTAVLVQAATWRKAATKAEVIAAGGRKVVQLGGKRVLLAEWQGEVYAVSNKCPHLGLPLVGRTKLLQGKVSDKCITCPAHGTAFNLGTGEVAGEWCPSLPRALANGLGFTPPKSLPVFRSRVTPSGDVEVLM